MTPQERQLIDDLFDRLAKLESAKRDPDAMSAIMQGLRNAPNAVYALVQTALAARRLRLPLLVRGDSNDLRRRGLPARLFHHTFLPLVDAFVR